MDEQNNFDESEIYQNILQNMQDGVIVIDYEGKIITLNSAAISILMIEEVDLIGKEFKKIFEKSILEPRNDDFNDTILDAIYNVKTTQHKDLKYYINETCKNLLISANAFFVEQEGKHKKKGILLVISDLTERERLNYIKNIFGKYIDPQIASRIISLSEEELKHANKQTITVSFCDMVNFTPLCENLSPNTLEELMNVFFSKMSVAVHKNRGVIDKFIGDSIMSFWGFPFTDKAMQTIDACQTALDQIALLPEIDKEILKILDPNIKVRINIRIGIATGELVIANIGSSERKSFTIMGKIVNLSSRLVGANKEYGTTVLVTRELMQSVGSAFEFREIDTIRVKGKEEHTTVYELLGKSGTLTEEKKKWIQLYEKALQHYRQRQWDEAEKLFKEALMQSKEDQASKVFLKRIKYFKKHPPPEMWDGAWHFETK